MKGPTATPCGECPQCVEIANGSSTDDVLEIDGASNRGIDQIRELRETVKYAPARSRYRVIIIDEAHQISKDGFNALLKTLEEPPPHVVFMMATTESQEVPETILSRCQRFQLRIITLTDIFDRLKRIVDAEKIPVEEAALRKSPRSAHGSLRDALSLLDQVIAFAPQGATVEDVRSLLGLLPGAFVRQFARRRNPEWGARQGPSSGSDRHRGRVGPVPTGGRSVQPEDIAFSCGKPAFAIPARRTPPKWNRKRPCCQRNAWNGTWRFSHAPWPTCGEVEFSRVTFELACLEIAQDAVSVNELVERLELLEKALR